MRIAANKSCAWSQKPLGLVEVAPDPVDDIEVNVGGPHGLWRKSMEPLRVSAGIDLGEVDTSRARVQGPDGTP